MQSFVPRVVLLFTMALIAAPVLRADTAPVHSDAANRRRDLRDLNWVIAPNCLNILPGEATRIREAITNQPDYYLALFEAGEHTKPKRPVSAAVVKFFALTMANTPEKTLFVAERFLETLELNASLFQMIPTTRRKAFLNAIGQPGYEIQEVMEVRAAMHKWLQKTRARRDMTKPFPSADILLFGVLVKRPQNEDEAWRAYNTLNRALYVADAGGNHLFPFLTAAQTARIQRMMKKRAQLAAEPAIASKINDEPIRAIQVMYAKDPVTQLKHSNLIPSIPDGEQSN